MENLAWSKKEKQITRQAFNKAYEKETKYLYNRTKEMVSTSKSPEDIWELHDFLTEKRKEVDNKYDYRYSVLIFALGRLISEGWITKDDLKGLGQEKINKIEQVAKFYRE